MLDVIKSKLRDIEQSENVRILHCVESGSRAWGFASPDSDYDVRFIYVRPVEYYLKLEKTSDVIEWQLDETLDINGWDLDKALKLLHSSNPTMFEWINSPIIYKTTDDWQNVAAIADKYFLEKSGLYHYLSMAKKNFREYLKGDEVRLKKYFYVIRPILACKWILSLGTPPPMEFSLLSDACLDKDMKPYINDLLKIKMNTPEIGTGKRIDPINEYIERNLMSLEEEINKLPYKKPTNWAELDKIFTDIVRAK